MDVRTNDFFAWDPVVGRVTYDVELSRLNGDVDRTASTTASSIMVGDLCGGPTPMVAVGETRRVRVRAVDAFGPGEWCFPIAFNLVGLPAPENLRVASA